MRKSTTTLTPAQVYRFASDFCQPHLDFQAKGKVTATILLTVLFAAAARISSISETCRRLADVPSEETYAKALYAQLFCLEELKRKVNAAFTAHLPRALRRRRKRPLRVAIDLTLIPYYGQYPLGHPEIYRSKAKAGTHSFFAYATAYVMLHGQRFTLAVTPVTRSETLKDVLQELLALISKAGLRPGLLLLDRGFYSVEIIRYLQQARRPFLMPVIGHGRKAGHPQGPSGSNVFKLMTKSGWFTHTLQNAKKKKATVAICVKRTRLTDRHGRKKWDRLGVCLLGDHSPARGLGQADLSEAVRDRDRLPADEPVPDSDDDQEVQRAVPLRGDRTVAEEPVGVAALLRPVEPAAGLPALQLGSPAGGADAALAGTGGRGDVWTDSHRNNRKRYTEVSYDMTRRNRSFGIY